VVNISDATLLISYVLYNDATDINLGNANCDQDAAGEINISDVTALISYVLTNNW